MRWFESEGRYSCDGRRGANMNHLRPLLLHNPRLWRARLDSLAAWLKCLTRGQRRRFAAAGLSGVSAVFLLALMAGPGTRPAHAATIVVDGVNCTLVDAVLSADGDWPFGGCEKGYGSDTIFLTTDVVVSTPYLGYMGLPAIESSGITIDGNGHTISRAPGAGSFRLFTVFNDLTLKNVVVANGSSPEGGGAAYVAHGTLTLDGVTLTGNRANESGGAIQVKMSSVLRVTNSVITGNTAQSNGGAIDAQSSTVYVSNSVISDNVAVHGNGGGVSIHDQRASIIESVISGNRAQRGGGVYSYAATAISRTTTDGNRAVYAGGGIYQKGLDSSRNLTLSDSTVSNNAASKPDSPGSSAGGGIAVSNGSATIRNSTISGNTSSGSAGGIVAYASTSTIAHSTVTGNHAAYVGGVNINVPWEATLTDNIISGNTGDQNVGDELGVVLYLAFPVDFTQERNVIGHGGVARSEALGYYTNLAASDIDATKDGLNVTIGSIINTTLGDNGGPTLTHNLVPGSPALDAVAAGACGSGTNEPQDQRGVPRPQGAGCDIGAVEFVPHDVFVSSSGSGSSPRDVDGTGVFHGSHDILRWDGASWQKWFDGATAGLDPAGSRFRHDISAFWIPDPDSRAVVMSFKSVHHIPGLRNRIDRSDLVQWDGEAFSLYFDGSDVGLNVLWGEQIDAVHGLPDHLSGEKECVAHLLVSTKGRGKVPMGDGLSLRVGGEDVLGFCATELGTTTRGTWEMIMDGSAEGLPPNSVDSISLDRDGRTIYFTTRSMIDVDSAAGSHSSVYSFDMETGEFAGPHFVTAENGLSSIVDGLEVVGDLRLIDMP